MTQDIDVLILGAGINGAGLFRDLCEQGVNAVIVDKADYGGGTSAAPSRLIHGGIKYLETGELRLVAQSTLERNLLLKNAPHLVKPLPTVIPIFSWLRGIGPALRTLMGSTTAPRSRGAVLATDLVMVGQGPQLDPVGFGACRQCFGRQSPVGNHRVAVQVGVQVSGHQTILRVCPCGRRVRHPLGWGRL